jgi:hypothetical protein
MSILARSNTLPRTAFAPLLAHYGKRSAKDSASEFVQQIHVRASKNVRQLLDIGTDVCRIIRRMHLVNDEGGTAWSFQPI